MGLDRPSDFAWMIGIFAIFMIVAGLGVVSVNENQGLTKDTSLYTGFINATTNASGLKGASDDQSRFLDGEATGGAATTEEGFFLRSWRSMLSLSKTFTAMKDATGKVFLGELSLDPNIWIIVTSCLLISFSVIMYAWLRGG